MFDLIIRGGAVYDGTGRPARWADVAGSGGNLAAVEPLPAARAARSIWTGCCGSSARASS